MENKEIKADFTLAINEAIQMLKARDIAASRLKIANAMIQDMNAPEPHNLLGILCELILDDNTARKHYRAAYALDPTYKPACRNLERLCTYELGNQKRDFDYGLDLEPVIVKSAHSNKKAHYFVLK